MSHRVTVQTSMTEKAHLITALKESKIAFSEQGDLIHCSSGQLNRATINMKTGAVSGDSDFHSTEDLGVLRQAYSLAKYKAELFTQGGSINSQTTDAVGNIILKCSAGLATPR